MAFRFYDYDNNKNIGSVDIVNLIKFLPTYKMDKIFNRQNENLTLKVNLNYKKNAVVESYKKKILAKMDRIEQSMFQDESSDEEISVSDDSDDGGAKSLTSVDTEKKREIQRRKTLAKTINYRPVVHEQH